MLVRMRRSSYCLLMVERVTSLLGWSIDASSVSCYCYCCWAVVVSLKLDKLEKTISIEKESFQKVLINNYTTISFWQNFTTFSIIRMFMKRRRIMKDISAV